VPKEPRLSRFRSPALVSSLSRRRGLLCVACLTVQQYGKRKPHGQTRAAISSHTSLRCVSWRWRRYSAYPALLDHRDRTPKFGCGNEDGRPFKVLSLRRAPPAWNAGRDGTTARFESNSRRHKDGRICTRCSRLQVAFRGDSAAIATPGHSDGGKSPAETATQRLLADEVVNAISGNIYLPRHRYEPSITPCSRLGRTRSGLETVPLERQGTFRRRARRQSQESARHPAPGHALSTSPAHPLFIQRPQTAASANLKVLRIPHLTRASPHRHDRFRAGFPG